MSQPVSQQNLAAELIAHGLAAQIRHALSNGTQPQMLIQILLDHATNICAMVEPAGVRAEFVKGIVESIPGMVRGHVARLSTTPGGIIVPKPGESLNGSVA